MSLCTDLLITLDSADILCGQRERALLTSNKSVLQLLFLLGPPQLP